MVNLEDAEEAATGKVLLLSFGNTGFVSDAMVVDRFQLFKKGKEFRERQTEPFTTVLTCRIMRREGLEIDFQTQIGK